MPKFFSEDLLQEIINANDLVETVKRYIPLKGSGRDYSGLCPFHREKTPSFHVSADKQLYHCFGCGVGGSVIQFTMAIENLDFSDAVRLLAERAGITIPETDSFDTEKESRKKKMYELNREAARFFRDMLFSEKGENARKYLENRRLTSKTVASFGIGYAPNEWDALTKHLSSLGFSKSLMAEVGLAVQNEKGHVYDRFRNRVMFPILDTRGNVIAFGGRILEGEGAKYVNSPESEVYQKRRTLFALNFAKNSKRDFIILCEGYMDVISLHQSDITEAVAGCGTALTEEQVSLLSRYTQKVVLCYDSDEAGQKACSRAIDLFRKSNVAVRILTVPEGKDPDEFIKLRGKAEFEKLIKDAKTIVQYELFKLSEKYDLDDIRGRVDFTNASAKILSQVTNAVERDAHIREISLKTGISPSAIETEVNKCFKKESRREVSSSLLKTSFTNPEKSSETTTRGKKAENDLICLLFSDSGVYKKYKDILSADLFTGTAKEIFEIFTSLYTDAKCPTEAELLPYFREREGELSKIFVASPVVNDPIEASADYIKILKEEHIAKEIKEAEKSGNIALLNELLLKKKGGNL